MKSNKKISRKAALKRIAKSSLLVGAAGFFIKGLTSCEYEDYSNYDNYSAYSDYYDYEDYGYSDSYYFDYVD